MRAPTCERACALALVRLLADEECIVREENGPFWLGAEAMLRDGIRCMLGLDVRDGIVDATAHMEGTAFGYDASDDPNDPRSVQDLNRIGLTTVASRLGTKDDLRTAIHFEGGGGRLRDGELMTAFLSRFDSFLESVMFRRIRDRTLFELDWRWTVHRRYVVGRPGCLPKFVGGS